MEAHISPARLAVKSESRQDGLGIDLHTHQPPDSKQHRKSGSLELQRHGARDLPLACGQGFSFFSDLKKLITLLVKKQESLSTVALAAS